MKHSGNEAAADGALKMIMTRGVEALSRGWDAAELGNRSPYSE